MNYVIIVAGGKGLRMGADVPKQFLLLGGKPVLMRTMEAPTSTRSCKWYCVTRDQQTYWRVMPNAQL